MFLYHYFDKAIGPFKNLSDLSIEEANRVLQEIAITKPKVQCARRNADYMQARIYYENILRNEFQKKGGIINRQVPHYMVVEHSPWLSSWYENSAYIKIPIEEFDVRTISFTYGDSHPTFSDRINDGKYGPERYIEAHIWSDDVIGKYLAGASEPGIVAHPARESWHGRMRACRGVGASKSSDELKKWDEEHWKMLMDNAPEQFNIKHYISIAVLERKHSEAL